VEAIVSANDEMTISIYDVCRSRGLVPGRDIAVTGYDDVEFAQRMDPPLTTANQDGLDMGYRALKCAVSLCKDPSNPIKMKDLNNRLSAKPKEEPYKTPTERGLDNLRKQLENPKKIDLSKLPKR
jgi:DNA-binding LacI/PurR family transcriptional regulator